MPRPRGRTSIVDQREVLNPAQIVDELIDPIAISQELQNNDNAIVWLARHRLLHNTCECDTCNEACSLINSRRNIDGKEWGCPVCKHRKSIRYGSFFSQSHLSLLQIMIVTLSWTMDMQQDIIGIMARIGSKRTVIDWCNFCREECEEYLARHSGPVGGMDENGMPLIVEIDRSQFFHRKYQNGQWHEDHWVFVGTERGTGKCFLVEVPNRSAETLEALIIEYILPGSHIVSDGWAANAHIDHINNGVYMHSVVNHAENFLDPYDRDIHTRTVQNLWMQAKRKLRRQYGTAQHLFPSYLHEFMYRNVFQNNKQKMINHFMVTLSDNYGI